MANFKQHFLTAAGASGIVSSGLLSLEYFTPEQAILGFTLGTIGGILPDLDSDHSKPLKMARDVMAITFAFIIMYYKAKGYSLVEMAILWIGIFSFIKYGIFNLFTKITIHRGMFHSVPAAIISGLIFVNIFYYFLGFDAMLAWAYSFFIFLGYMIHLVLDELVSLNLMGDYIKKSLGTALKFYDKNNLITSGIVYVVMIGLFFIAPFSFEFNEMIKSDVIYKDIFNILLPAGEWFKDLFSFKSDK